MRARNRKKLFYLIRLHVFILFRYVGNEPRRKRRRRVRWTVTVKLDFITLYAALVRILDGFYRKTMFYGRVYIKFVLWISVFSYGIIMLYCLIRIILGRQMMRAQANNILSVLGNNASV